jgi:hypothetical protein
MARALWAAGLAQRGGECGGGDLGGGGVGLGPEDALVGDEEVGLDQRAALLPLYLLQHLDDRGRQLLLQLIEFI